LYVANDGDANQLWLNVPEQTRFVDDAPLAGVAYSMQGAPQAGMGVDAGDIDDDGDDDLVVAHLSGEANALYVNQGEGLFEDRAIAWSLQASSLPVTSFGAHFLDGDLDGDLDLAVVNGAVRLQHDLMRREGADPLLQTNQLFENDGGEFREITDQSGPDWASLNVGRGLAVGDVDNDGDHDLLITSNGGPARLLLGTASEHRHWIGLTLCDRAGHAGVTQALVRIEQPPDRILQRRSHTDGSYLSASDPRVLVGLGEMDAPCRVAVTWPNGASEAWEGLAADRYHDLQEGTGTVVTR
ncbi:MAG: CRTAC1 family protein, partial [Planctomycetaceae bacterium]|nr:CRTAC1 family protein [Planctomycetaceae bacterium]